MKNQYNNWESYSHNVAGRLITTDLIHESFNCFYIDRLEAYSPKDIFLIQLIVKTETQGFRSITKVELYSNNLRSSVLEKFKEFWELKNEDYKQMDITHILFKYKLLSISTQIDSAKLTKASTATPLTSKRFNFIGFNLPTTMNLIEWGECHFNKDYSKAIINNKRSKTGQFEVKIYDNYTVVEYRINGEVAIKFIDEPFDNRDLTSFKRTLFSNKHEYYIIDGSVELKQIQRKCNYINQDHLKYFHTKKIITMDLETRLDKNNNFVPYCICMYDGKEFNSYYLSDFTDSTAMLTRALNNLKQRKYKDYRVYLHNFSYFDGIFLLNIIITNYDKVEPIMRDHKLIDIKAKWVDHTTKSNVGRKPSPNKATWPKKPKYFSIHFRDSYLMLPSKLSTLAKSFNVENKGMFPYKFANNLDINLDYEGQIPELKYFINSELN